ncbi:hypothetical protein KY284_032873 [Solanum tuberosum]|nr:hypothetical protein KY284_032873 [Solanum tuberosum]
MATRNLHSITKSSNQCFFIPLRVNPNHLSDEELIREKQNGNNFKMRGKEIPDISFYHGKTRSSLKRRRSQKDGIQATQRHLRKRRWRAH